MKTALKLVPTTVTIKVINAPVPIFAQWGRHTVIVGWK